MAVLDAGTVSLLNLNNNITDEKGLVWTAVGEGQFYSTGPLSTLKAYGNGTNKVGLKTPATTDLTLAAGKPFSIDMQIWGSTTVSTGMYARHRTGTGGSAISVSNLTTLALYSIVTGISTATLSVPLVVNKFNHVAFTYDGTTIRVFVGGVLSWSTTAALVPANTDANVYVNADSGLVGTLAIFCEWRFSNYARWTSNFTPPYIPTLNISKLIGSYMYEKQHSACTVEAQSLLTDGLGGFTKLPYRIKIGTGAYGTSDINAKTIPIASLAYGTNTITAEYNGATTTAVVTKEILYRLSSKRTFTIIDGGYTLNNILLNGVAKPKIKAVAPSTKVGLITTVLLDKFANKIEVGV